MAHYTDGTKVKVGDAVQLAGVSGTVTKASDDAGNEAAVTIAITVTAGRLDKA
jgi:hypothetical protein